MSLTHVSDDIRVNRLHSIFESPEVTIGMIHYSDVIMSTIASSITSFTIVYSTVYSGADQRKHQSSASLAFVRGIHRGPVNSPHKWPVTRKMFPFDDVIMLRISGSRISHIGIVPANIGRLWCEWTHIDWQGLHMVGKSRFRWNNRLFRNEKVMKKWNSNCFPIDTFPFIKPSFTNQNDSDPVEDNFKINLWNVNRWLGISCYLISFSVFVLWWINIVLRWLRTAFDHLIRESQDYIYRRWWQTELGETNNVFERIW